MNDPIDFQSLRKNAGFRPSPFSRDDVRVHRFGAARPSPIHYFIFRDVLDELSFAATYQDQPAYAALTGGFGAHEGTGFVELSGFEDLVYPDSDTDIVEAYRETVRQQVNQRTDNEVIVGLFVAAPGSRAVIPQAAAHMHLSLFNVPFQPLLVVDPDADCMAIYGRAPRRTFVDAPLHVVSPIATPEPDSA